MGSESRVGWDENRPDLLPNELGKGWLDIFNNAKIKTHQRERCIGRGGLRLLPFWHVQRVRDIHENANARKVWQQCTNQVELFRREFLSEVGEPRNVAARMRQT